MDVDELEREGLFPWQSPDAERLVYRALRRGIARAEHQRMVQQLGDRDWRVTGKRVRRVAHRHHALLDAGLAAETVVVTKKIPRSLYANCSCVENKLIITAHSTKFKWPLLNG